MVRLEMEGVQWSYNSKNCYTSAANDKFVCSFRKVFAMLYCTILDSILSVDVWCILLGKKRRFIKCKLFSEEC